MPTGETMNGGDERGQAGVIGFVIVFGFLVALLGINQAFIVPLENEGVEVHHSQDVRDDMVDLRDDTFAAAVNGNQQVTPVRLGSTYPNRFFALNPPEPTGRFQTTTPSENITVDGADFDIAEETCGVGDSSDGVDTVFVDYEANYNEFQTSLPLTMENTVTYRKDDSRTVLDTEQDLIDDNRIWIVRLTGDYQTTGSKLESVDLLPSETGRNVTSGAFNITIPTELDEDEWEELLSDEINDGNVAEVVGGDDNVTIVLEDDTYIVRCTTVGINEQPDVDPVKEPLFDTNTTNAFNPTGPGTVELVEIDRSGGVNLTFENNIPEPVRATEARIPFASDSGSSQAGAIKVAGTVIPIGQRPVALNPEIRWEANDDGSDVDQELVTTDAKKQTAFALEVKFVNDETGQTYNYLYFVGDEGGEEETGESFSVEIDSDSVSDEATKGETVSVTAMIENEGTETTTQNIELVVEDNQTGGSDYSRNADDKDVELAGGESANVTLEWKTNQGNPDTPEDYDLIVKSNDDDDVEVITLK